MIAKLTKQKLTKQRQKSYKKFIKFTKKINKKFNKSIKHLKKAKNKHKVSYIFSNTYNLAEYIGINCNPCNILHKYHVYYGADLIDTYKYDLHSLEYAEAFHAKSAKQEKDINSKSINTLESKFAFADGYNSLGYHWYIVNNNYLKLLNKDTAIDIIKCFQDE